MKTLTKFLTVFLLVLLGASNLWATNYTVYFSPNLSGKSWSTPYVYYNRGWNETGFIKMTDTGNTFHGYKVYSATVTDHESSGNFNQVSFCRGDNDWQDGQIDACTTWSSIQSGKIWTANNTSDNYTPDTQFTLYFVKSSSESSWTTPWVNVKRGYSHWANVEMTNTGKTYNGSVIYSATIPAQGFDQIEFHKSENNYDNKVLAAEKWTTVNGQIYAKVSSSWAWRDYNYDVTLTFKNGSTTVDTKRTLKDGSITAPSAPSKTGYTFAGWKNGSTTVQAGGTISNVQADATYDAQWTANTNTPYTVKHYKQNLDGTYPSTATETENLTGTTDASVTPAVKNYTGFTAPSTQTKTIAADGSLVVEYKYTRNSHTLTWNANGGTIDGEPTKVETLKYGAEITVPQTSSLSYSGHNFTGWNTTPASTMPDNDVTYTAQWEVAATATVTYDGNGNTGGTVPTDATTYAPGATVTVLTGTPEKTGYNFNGWKNSDGGAILSAGSTFTINSSVTLTAQWEIVNYSITYNGLEGGTHTNPANYTIETATITLTDASRDNYTFDGWYDAETGGNKVTQITIGSTGNKTLWARWSETLHSVNIVSGTGIESVSPAGATNVGNITPVTITATVKAGYTWEKWTTDHYTRITFGNANENPTTIKATEETNVYANATENMTTITINANQTTWGRLQIGSTEQQWGSTRDAGVTTTRNLTATPNTGYKFVNWTLTGGAVLKSGSLTDATITIKGNGTANSTGTAVATFAEDLTANWYIKGDKNLLTKCSTGWEKNEAYRFSKPNKDASSAYIDIEITQEQVGKTYEFKLQDCGVPGEPMYGWGTSDGDYHTFTQTETFGIYNNNGSDHNLKITPSIKGTYRFSIDWSSGHNLTVTWPSVNDLHHNFTGEWTHTACAVNEGVLTANYEITQAMIDGNNLEFEFIYDGVYYGPGIDKTEMTATNHSNWDLQANKGTHVAFKPSIAGIYTFEFNGSTKKLNVTYPVPDAPASITVTAERYFGEDKINDFIATDPYQVYTDEKIVLTIDEVAAPTGCTTYYQFGENEASTERTFTIENPTTAADQSIEAKVFFRPNAGGEDGEAVSETIYYQGVATPQLHLTASWYEKEENAVADNEQVTIYYSTTNYNGAATVTSQVDNAAAQPFMSITSEINKNADYQLPDKGLHRYTFTATATVNSRTFTATTSVSVYRLVKITVTDTDNLMDHYYMWIQDSNPIQQEQAWPGSTFYSKLGNAHIFYVKYPSYTHFVLNNGKNANEEGAAQTIDIVVPDQSACYTIGTQIVSEDADNGKYAVQEADECPNKLSVGDIADVAMYNGEGKLVQPQVDTDPELDVANLNISVTFDMPNIVTYDQRGTGFMLTALSKGTTTATVTYSIAGATDVVKSFDVTVGEAITIQAKIGTNLGWNSHEAIWIKYWGTDGEHNTQMKFVKYVAGEDGHGADGQDYYTARLPMPDGSNKIRFKIGYPNGTSWDDAWRNSAEVPDVDKSGCYTIYYVEGENANRGISRDGDNCFVEYQVEIDMTSGISYFSNKVDNNTDIVSFFAPGSDKKGYEAGSVRIMKNGEQSASIPAEMFETSGVYTAKISGEGTGLTEVALYKGDYYIRTDAAAGDEEVLSTGWDDYKKTSHKFTQFSLYPGAKYNYYWVRNNKRTSDETHFNVKGCVGNDYNPDLANMISVNDYTDSNGDIVQDKSNGVNLRFGYNPQTNYFERAILKGAGDNYFLNIQGDNVYNDENCSTQVLNEANYNSHPEYSKFNDVSDWVYEKLIFAKIDGTYPLAKVVLKSKSFNDKIMYQLGYEVDDHGRATKTPIQKVVMGNGTEQGKYALRVIYDYKTNRLSATWEPSGEIDKVMQVDADILFVSNEGEDVKEISFTGDSTTARLTSLQSVMYVLELENNYDPKTSAPDAQYWIALPFECKISDIFGIENYITLDENRIAQSGYWGIMRYRGDLRAQKGWFLETNSFWEWMYPTETLMPGEGYVLYVEKSSLSWNSITVEEPCEGTEDGCHDGKKSVDKFVKRFYFPSLVEGFTMNKSTDASSKTIYPNQPCNITSPVDRRAEDSNWKVIAPKSYNNVSIKSAEDQDKDYILEGPGFIYTYDAAKAKGSRYTATSTEDFEFKAFHGYMAQYGGTITWNPYSKTEHPTSAPRFGAANDNFKGGMLTIELVQNDEQLDRTFISLSKNGTTGFDQNLDLTKITENCAQIASVSENVVYAGSTLPLDIELVPLNIKVTANGMYDIALEKSLEGLEVKFYDAFEQTTTLLDQMPATITLNKGEYKDRFYLQLTRKNAGAPTNLDGNIGQYNLPTDKTQKLLINGNIYLINAGRVYNATGTMVR